MKPTPWIALTVALASCVDGRDSYPAGSAAEGQRRSIDAPEDSRAPQLGSIDTLPVIEVARQTPPLHGYDDAPRTPDADDPAIWVHPRDPARSLIIATLKESGLQVYDLSGRVVQTVVPAFRPAVTAADPPAPGGVDPGTRPCPGSTSGETFGRFNNVDVLYGFERDVHGHRERVDIAVATDRGCDRLRVFAIDPRSAAPLTEITSPRAGRIFPERFVQPSPYQPTAEAGLVANGLDEQSTGYGLALARTPAPRAFVTQRRRARVAELQLTAERDGTVGYQRVRELRFPVVFDVGGRRPWTPCREDASEDPQLEGLVVDEARDVLYASQEVVGVWRIELSPQLPAVVHVPPRALIQRTRSFGQAYWAIPDGDEFACESPAGAPPADAIIVAGNPAAAGDILEADVEGLAIYRAGRRDGYLLVSSQGDDTYHAFDLRDPRTRIASFQVEGTGETDGHAVTNVALGGAFPHGLFVTQNGKAAPPASTAPINGFAYDNSTQFQLVDWHAIAAPLGLAVDTHAFDPRR